MTATYHGISDVAAALGVRPNTVTTWRSIRKVEGTPEPDVTISRGGSRPPVEGWAELGPWLEWHRARKDDNKLTGA